MQTNLQKMNLYILSLGLLFVFFIIISFKLPKNTCILLQWSLSSVWHIINANMVSIISIIALLYSIIVYIKFQIALGSSTDLPFTIKKIENSSYENLTFLATYIIPLISFDFDNNRQLIILAILLIVMGIIYIKTDLFYANPSLALLGFKLYKADGNFKNGERNDIILITRERLSLNDKATYIKLDERIYYVKKVG
ncbi:anti-phage protein KwaA [Histophilus somni]|uniref:anti-phage protein KwaA n=1 Tax=Histophilus somni TaxID=731 RepID=UPI00201E79AC|nr:anti-phage protein KwaA [Histophilus somni]